MAENNSGVVDSPMILDNNTDENGHVPKNTREPAVGFCPPGSNSKDKPNEERIEMAELITVTDDAQITTVSGSEDSTSRGKAIFLNSRFH